ncbi:MAG: anaerobic ribonucleoside-triphosphate reductase activating protein [Campylobacterota bacterium]|nr:anaerobic ribonucleoside-triphosphate reductase activating protein [Campylobacterota bacterium]
MPETHPLYDITPFTALDYPDHLAAIFWFAGCNMRCDFCYNVDIVFGEGSLTIDEALEFLQTRVGLLDGVVLSGGEATLYDGLPELCRQIKTLGFKIKLDTNGLQTEMIKTLVEEKLVDYIALDYKAPAQKFAAVTKNRHYEKFEKTLRFLIVSDISFEVRTTLHPDLLNEEDINLIIADLKAKGYEGNYYIQHFITADKTIGKMAAPEKAFDQNKVSDAIPVFYRN